MAIEHPAVQQLTLGILNAARLVAEPLQSRISAASGREVGMKWLGIAFESVSFCIVFSTWVARSYCPQKTQEVINAVGRAVCPEIAQAFFSRNPPETQAQMINAFLAGHYQAELAYGDCERVLPTDHDDASSLVYRFTYRLRAALGSGHSLAVSDIASAVQEPECTPKIFELVRHACDALPG